MEIVHLILGKANPNRMNGINKVVNSLASTQSSLGIPASVWGITPTPQESYPERNYRTELFPALRHKLTVCNQLKHRIHRAERGTVFHIHGGFVPEFYHCARAIHKAGHEYIHTPHGAYNTIAMQRSHRLKKVYFKLFEREVVRHAKAVHCIGKSEIDATRDLTSHDHCVLIPNGQQLEALDFEYAPIEHQQGPVFGYCGRIDIYTKGLDLLIEGFAHYAIKEQGSGSLWIIGDGPGMHGLKALVEEIGLGNRVRFWGKRFGQHKLNILANMDAFLHPSRNEGLPGAVLEAAGLGIPCIVSEASNMAGYIRKHEAGIALSQNTPDQIGWAMEEIENRMINGEIRTMKHRAAKMVKTEFDWKSIAQQLQAVYAG